MSDVPNTTEAPAPAGDHATAVNGTEAAATAPETAGTQPSTTVEPTEAEAPVAGGEAPKEEILNTNEAEAAAEATPVSEGLLGYKAPGLIPKIRFAEQFFWFDEAAVKPETLTRYLRSKELKLAHPTAAWAQETGKGLLFYAKRAEDKPSPEGIINLSDISEVTKIEDREFSFKTHSHKHTFQAATKEERVSWIAVVEKMAEEAKGMKKSMIESEGYKNHMKDFTTSPALGAGVAAITTRTNKSATQEPKKSLDAATATDAPKAEAAATGATEESKKQKEPKSRSQSRKRSSIFGALLGKKEEREEQKEVKKEEKKEEKEAAREQKAEEKVEKEEAKATPDLSKAVEADAATAGAAAPAAVIAPEEKRSKRASIFGNIFAKKDATSPTAEKTEEVAPAVPAKDAEIPPVSETAPKIEKPIENKPIDTAAVTAPIDTVQTPAAVEEPTKEKKGGIIGFIKKQEAKFEGKKEHKKEEKVEKKEEKTAEPISEEPVAATAVDTPAVTSEAAAPATEETRPAEKRRQSFFSGLGTIKRKITETTPETETTTAETKKEKSPLPQKIGGLFRRPSKNPKPVEETKAEASSAPVTNGITTNPESATKDESAATNGNTTEEPAVVADAVPDNVPTSVLDAVNTSTPEVKAAA